MHDTPPPLSHDMPRRVIKALVRKDPETGAWCWMHRCPHRLTGQPFYGLPTPFWDEAYAMARFHAELCQ